MICLCSQAEALWTVFGYKDDSDLWWWENEDLTSNIFLHSCVDFLAFGRKNSDGRDQAPVAKVSLDEKLSKVIGRACTSPFRHVVVYEEANDRQLRDPCPLSSSNFGSGLGMVGKEYILGFGGEWKTTRFLGRRNLTHGGCPEWLYWGSPYYDPEYNTAPYIVSPSREQV